MTHLSSIFPKCLLPALLLLAVLVPVEWVNARNPEHLDEQYRTLNGYLQQGEIKQGMVLLDLILNEFGPTAAQEVGPSFGKFYYLKGLFLLAEQKVEKALPHFVTCHQTYANPPQSAANPVVDEALVRHIECLIALERYGQAPALLSRVDQKGLEKMSDQWAWFMNRGLVMIHTGKGAEGIAYFQRLLEDTTNPNVTPSMRMEVIRLLAVEWAGAASEQEVITFLDVARPIIRDATPLDRRLSNPFFLDAARLAFDAQQSALSLRWLSVFDRAEVLEQIKEPDPENGRPNPGEELLKGHLALTATVYQTLGNPLGALPVLEEMIRRYPKEEQTPQLMYNLAVGQVSAGLYGGALRTALALRETYPDNPLAGELESTILELLVATGEWTLALDVAEGIMARGQADPATEMAGYVLGMNAYEAGDYGKAQQMFQQLVTQGLSGAYASHIQYYLAATKVQLEDWKGAAEILEAFLADEQKPEWASPTLLLYAQSLLQDGRPLDAKAALENLLENHAGSAEEASASWMLAQLLAQTGTAPGEVGVMYEQALSSAQREGDAAMEKEALKGLLFLAADSGETEKASQLFDQFFQNPNRTVEDVLEVMDRAWDGLAAAGRSGDLQRRMEDLLKQEGSRRDSPRLRKVLNSYVAILERTPEGASRLGAFAKTPGLPVPLLSSLILLQAEALPADDSEGRMNLYTELDQNLPLVQIPSYVLIRLARWQDEQGATDRAATIRNQVLETRQGEPGFELALLDAASVQAESEDPQQVALAKEWLQQVMATTQDPEVQEMAQLGMARVFSRTGEWKQAETAWETYLAERDWTAARAEANFEYARSIEEGGNPRKALGYYVSIYANFEGDLDWSSQAALRAARMIDLQGNRKDALLMLQDLLRRTRDQNHPGIEEARQQFRVWREEFIRAN